MVSILPLLLSAPALANAPSCDELEGAQKAECERDRALTMATARLAELGDCDIKRRKKRDACLAEKGELELRVAELEPPPAEEKAEEPAKTRSLAPAEPKGEATGLELDISDE